jgi:hypothetical protein
VQSAQPSGQQPFVVTVVPATPAPERDLADVVIGALGITVSLVLVALVFGAVLGVIRLGWVRRHPPDADHMPPVRPEP